MGSTSKLCAFAYIEFVGGVGDSSIMEIKLIGGSGDQKWTNQDMNH